ncbi:hypothetical protein DAI22_08g229100 [Oryza sativa Japonica Group]|nr:hypothetical protein DAI22_08g229100 [Oryza sativa Japonica Group]
MNKSECTRHSFCSSFGKSVAEKIFMQRSILFLCLKVLLLETFEGEEDEVLEYHLMVLV